MKILHISDTHANHKALKRLELLAQRTSQLYDVVALTGDVVSSSNEGDRVPETWNHLWPQSLKLSVPGNHDVDRGLMPLAHLSNWEHDAPWCHSDRKLLFFGFDLNDMTESGKVQSQSSFQEFYESVAKAQDVEAVVVLSHYRWRLHDEAEEKLKAVAGVLGKRPLPILHGHEHSKVVLPDCFQGSQWDEPGWNDVPKVYRSNVYSAWHGCGCAHQITWWGGSWANFKCVRVD